MGDWYLLAYAITFENEVPVEVLRYVPENMELLFMVRAELAPLHLPARVSSHRALQRMPAGSEKIVRFIFASYYLRKLMLIDHPNAAALLTMLSKLREVCALPQPLPLS